MKEFRRALVLGPLGAGKTQFSIELSNYVSLPVVHLDREFLLPNYTKPNSFDWERRVQIISASQQWIMDGNFFDVMECRLKRADVVFYLNFPQRICTIRLLRRTLSNIGKVRKDIGLPERIHLLHLIHAATYKSRKESKFQSTLVDANRRNIPVIQFMRPETADSFLCKYQTSTIIKA